MSGLAAELARHVDPDARQHHLVLLAPDRLRCLVCTQTIDLRPALTAVPGSTSTSKGIPGSTDPQCPQHRGEWAHACRWCRAEAIEARLPKAKPFSPTADLDRRVAEARAELSAANTRSHRPEEANP